MRVYQLVLLIFVVWQSTKCNAISECNQQTVGTAFCLNISRYTGSQWTTCLTDAYIREKSRQTHQCEGRAAICHYQCMLEIHQKNYGPVYSDCQCEAGKPVSTAAPLPRWCLSPDGSKCNWYRECLKQRYPCEQKDDEDYAIDYAEKFCELYAKSYNEFSSNDRHWIDAVRKCLQVALVPFLRAWQTVSCKTLKEKAFESHTPCYLNPGENAVSYCDLSLQDKWKVFWTIKSGFKSAFLPSLKGAWDVLVGCLARSKRPSHEETKTTLIQIRFTITILYEDSEISPRKKRAVGADEEELGYFAGRVIDAIATQQEWRKKGVAWFAFASNRTRQQVNITSMLADRYTYEAANFSPIAKPNHPADINVTLSKMVEALEKGSFNTLQIGTDKVGVKRMEACANLSCEEFRSFEVQVALSPSPSPVANGIIICLTSIILLLRLHVITGIDI